MYKVQIDENNRVVVDSEQRVCRQERTRTIDISRSSDTKAAYKHRWETVELIRQGIGQNDAEYQARCYARSAYRVAV